MKQYKQMATLLLTAVISMVNFMTSSAQSKPLNGSGRIISRNFDFNQFDKLCITDMSGEVEVMIGKSFSIKLQADDNFNDRISLTEKDGVLQVFFDGNRNNRMYIENTNIRLVITMPEISVLEQYGNSNCSISGIHGRYLRIKNRGNGNITATGYVDELDIIKRDNGNVDAGSLETGKAIVEASGNGNVWINTNNVFQAHTHGNGIVKNRGKGKPSSNSSASGNSSIQ